MAMKLFHYWRSSSSYRVRWALALKGLDVEHVAVNLLANEQEAASYREASPLGFVPALEVDGRVLTESVAICEWLEDVFPTPSLRPADPWLRARMRQLVEIVNAGTQPPQNLLVLKKVSSDKAVQAEWARFFIGRGLAAYEAALATLRKEGVAGPFSCGAEPTLADVFLLPQLYNARRFEVSLAALPLVSSVEAAAKAHPTHAAAAPEAFEPRG